jgi:glycosyltransferase involved in cell wall biosynthesis
MTADLSGVQRYVSELCVRLGEKLQRIAPTHPLQGIKGHIWEQCLLPCKIRSRLLWSPANTGPVFYENQVVTVHDLAALDHPEWFAPKFSAWYRCMVPRLVKRARQVIAVSDFTKQRLVESTRINPEKIHVIPNGVDERFCPSTPAEVGALLKRLNIPSSRYVLSIGTLEPRKNLRGQLEAWSRCVGEIPADTWLVVAGRLGKRHVFEEVNLDGIPDRVHFTGFVPDVDLPTLYGGALALLYPSVYEGFGLPALEAMASGTTPIVSNSTALPELVSDAALTVDPRDNESIAAALALIVTNSQMRDDLRERAIRRAQTFNWEKTAAMTWDVLSEASAQ